MFLSEQYSYKFGKRSFFARSNFLSDDMGLREAAAAATAAGPGAASPRSGVGVERPGGGGGSGDGASVGVAVAPPLTRSQQGSALQGLQAAPAPSPSLLALTQGPMTVSLDTRQVGWPAWKCSLSPRRHSHPGTSTPLLSLDTRQMGDVAVKYARLTPAALAHGEWPADYTLSDHGMVEVVFSVPPPPVAPLDVIDPQPRARKSKTGAEEE